MQSRAFSQVNIGLVRAKSPLRLDLNAKTNDSSASFWSYEEIEIQEAVEKASIARRPGLLRMHKVAVGRGLTVVGGNRRRPLFVFEC